MQIVKIKDLAKDVFAEIKRYQIGKKKIIKTNRPYIDDVGIGLVNGSVVTVAGNSGTGKSFELSRILDNILNIEVNPDAAKYISLNISLEMRMFSLILRGLDGKMEKDKKDILLSEFTEEEKAIALSYYESLQDERRFISQTPTTPKQFYETCDEFLQLHTEAESVVISIDHIVLMNSDKSAGKQQVVEELIEYINNLKMKHENVVFILLSQTNSENSKRAKDKDRMAQPQPLDLYYSQFTFQVSDYVCVIMNPNRMGIKEYSKVNPERYQHLSDLFLEPDSKGNVSLETDGVIYYHLLKCREAGVFFDDIFADRLFVPKGYKEKKSPFTTTIPVFGNETMQVEKLPPVLPNFSLKDAFDTPEIIDKSAPF